MKAADKESIVSVIPKEGLVGGTKDLYKSVSEAHCSILFNQETGCDLMGFLIDDMINKQSQTTWLQYFVISRCNES